MQEQESLDAGCRRQVLVDPAHMFFDEGVHLGLLGEVGVRGVGELPVLGPFAYVGEIDVDEGRDIRQVAAAKDHGFPNVGAEFEFILNELRTELGAVGQGHHVLGPVDDDEMAVLVEVARVARVQPAFFVNGFPGGLRVLVIPHHDRGRTHEDFACLFVDFHFRLGNGQAHRLELDVAIPVQHRDTADFRLPVDLFQVDSQRVEEAEHIGSQSRASGIGPFQMPQAQLVLDLLEHQPVGQEVLDAQPQGRLLLGKAGVGHFIANGQGPVEEPALEGGGVLDFHLNLADQALPNAGWTEHHLGADFPQIVLHGLGTFGKVDFEPNIQPAGHGHHLFANPCQGQEGDVLIVGFQGVHGHEVLGHAQQVLVRQHGQFGPRGGAGSRGEDGQVRGLALGQTLLEPTGVLFLKGFAQGDHVVEVHQVGLVVGPQTFGVVVDDLVDPVLQGRPDFDDFVHLFLVLGHDEGRIGPDGDVFHFRRDGILINAHGFGPQGLGRQFGDDPLRTVVADDGHGVFGLESQFVQTQREVLDEFIELPPGHLLPDAVNTLPKGHPVWVLLGMGVQVLR